MTCREQKYTHFQSHTSPSRRSLCMYLLALHDTQAVEQTRAQRCSARERVRAHVLVCARACDCGYVHVDAWMCAPKRQAMQAYALSAVACLCAAACC